MKENSGGEIDPRDVVDLLIANDFEFSQKDFLDLGAGQLFVIPKEIMPGIVRRMDEIRAAAREKVRNRLIHRES